MPKAKRAKKVEARRKREFTHRGKTLAELRGMNLEELSRVLNARARRSIRRGFNRETSEFFERMRTTPAEKVVRTHCRDALVLPEHVGRRVAIHDGHQFREVEVRAEMVGHYYGEFSLTRKFEKHSGPGVGATRSSKFMPLK
jgi:small subunit ribosomal protein S19